MTLKKSAEGLETITHETKTGLIYNGIGQIKAYRKETIDVLGNKTIALWTDGKYDEHGQVREYNESITDHFGKTKIRRWDSGQYDEYGRLKSYAEAITDELIGYLGKIRALRVISRQSVMQYKGSDKSLSEIARKLNVDAVVVGTVLCGSKRIRIRAELISAVPERTLWGDSYDREFSDVVILSSQVAWAIAQQIKVRVTPAEQVRMASARPVNLEAYKLYRMGKDHYFKRIFLRNIL